MPVIALPKSADLSRGKSPALFFVPLVSHITIEEWRADEEGCHDLTIPHNNWCAMCATKMIQLLEGRPSPPLDPMFEHACEVGVYKQKLGGDGKGWKGMYHHPFARFLGTYGFSAHVREGIDVETIARAIASGYYVIPSVSPEIRFPRDDAPAATSGHVVLAYAYSTDSDGERVLRIQNCAGFESLDSQKGFPVSASRMQQLFSGTATFVRSPLYGTEGFLAPHAPW